MTSRPGTESEDRVRMLSLIDGSIDAAELRRLLNDAALIVPAFGYRAGTVPVFDASGRRLRLKADEGGPAVGRDARVQLADGRTIKNIFGIGLGADYKPWGPMGGEPSFEGQANSLWLYQNDIGGVVYEGVRDCLEAARTTRALRQADTGNRAVEDALDRKNAARLSLYAVRP
jgi:hypothetical protein